MGWSQIRLLQVQDKAELTEQFDYSITVLEGNCTRLNHNDRIIQIENYAYAHLAAIERNAPSQLSKHAWCRAEAKGHSCELEDAALKFETQEASELRSNANMEISIFEI